MGALGAPASEQAFECPACAAALSGAQLFSCAALAQAGGPRSGGEAGGSAVKLDDDAGGAQAGGLAGLSAKLSKVLALLADVRARNQGGPAGWAPCPSPAPHKSMMPAVLPVLARNIDTKYLGHMWHSTICMHAIWPAYLPLM